MPVSIQARPAASTAAGTRSSEPRYLLARRRCVIIAGRGAPRRPAPLAERVLVGDDGLDEQRSRCEDHAQALLALHASVAHDLRLADI
jgi:hypothetical protein